MVTWRLKTGLDRRFRSGHPWVYSNELAESPKGIEPGAEIELRDAGGKFLARGFGNPSSLIAFRAVSRDPEEKEPLSADGILSRLKQARDLRARLGLSKVSHRWVFAEADRLPGLIIDRYLLEDGAQAAVIQAHTAGMSARVEQVVSAIEKIWVEERAWDRASVVLRNDVGIRKLEGLAEEEPKLLKAGSSDLASARILAGAAVRPIPFRADLVGGQKTGFFLDQAADVGLAIERLAPLFGDRSEVRILDLCCYVGQWGARLAQHLRSQGKKARVTAVDASARALELARANIEAQGGECETLRADVLKELGGLPAESYDWVISDPPALIKGRKDIPAGTHAYLQLNSQALRLLAPGGGIVTCSCSALLEEDELMRVLAKAANRAQRSLRWIARGGQAPDHPVLAEFPEGRYLKCWIGVRD